MPYNPEVRQKPALWILRTRPFWSGLIILLFLTFFWIATSLIETRLSYTGSGVTKSYLMVVNEGRITFAVGTVTDPSAARGYPSGWSAGFVPHVGINWKGGPAMAYKSPAPSLVGYWASGFAVPLWILPFGWAVLWPLLLIRSDFRERRLLGDVA